MLRSVLDWFDTFLSPVKPFFIRHGLEIRCSYFAWNTA
jgi:hypothetical protein